MSHPLHHRLIPQALFVKLVGIDRNTFENWTRSGALSFDRAADDSGRNSPRFSIGALIKVKMMLSLKEQLFMPPKQSAAFADQLLDAHADEIGAAFAEFSMRLSSIRAGELGEGDPKSETLMSRPLFSGVFYVDLLADGGPRLTHTNGTSRPGSIQLILPLTSWLAETAVAFAAFREVMGGPAPYEDPSEVSK